MARPRSRRPTDAETQILGVLWERGEATVRDVWEGINVTKKTAYTSVATIMRIMLQKGTIKLIEERRPQRFAPNLTKAELGVVVIDDLCEGVFAGSLITLLRHALVAKKRTPEEIAELRTLVEELAQMPEEALGS